MSVSATFLPHSPNIWALYACGAGIGMGAGVINSMMNVWLTELWQEKSKVLLQFPGFAFGIGAILSPLIIKPYLMERNLVNVTVSNGTGYNSTKEEWMYDHEYEQKRRSNLYVPFLFLGAFQLICEYYYQAMLIGGGDGDILKYSLKIFDPKMQIKNLKNR